MRIIAGRHKGRKLQSPADTGTTRPITDRLKTAVFDRLESAGRIEGAAVLDVYAGTGSMGLECLSRGAAHVTFVEKDRDARRRLKHNLKAIGQADDATVDGIDALSRSLLHLAERLQPNLVFFDPPYAHLRDERTAGRIAEQMDRLAACCDDEAELILRTERKVTPPELSHWHGPDSRQQGSMTVHVYRRR